MSGHISCLIMEYKLTTCSAFRRASVNTEPVLPVLPTIKTNGGELVIGADLDERLVKESSI
jgi:hypothetical protein